MRICKIVQKSLVNDRIISRDIISFLGMPFYSSTGLNSGYPGTWFPFYGINQMGVFVKRMQDDGTLPQPFHTYFQPSSCYDKRTNDLSARFGTIVGLLISSTLGGGLWESCPGKKLKGALQDVYPKFYETMPELEFVESRNRYTDHNLFLINNWILESAGLSDIRHLQKSFPTTVPDLTFMIKSNIRVSEIHEVVISSGNAKAITGSDSYRQSRPNRNNQCVIL